MEDPATGPIEAGPFRPAWWCRHPHMQTLWPSLFHRVSNLRLRRERLELPDGDFIDLDWTEGRSGPIVVVLHGLQGSSRSPYARGLLHAVHQRGWRGVVLHFRGCSGVPNRLPRAYHSGDSPDLAFCIDTLRRREPDTSIAVVGYSLGGNVALKWLGEAGAQAAVHGAVAVCVPMSLDIAARRLDQGFSRVYQWALLQSSVRSIRRRFKGRQSVPVNLAKLRSIRSCWQFDDEVTAPLHGFRDAAHYYESTSARRYLKGIKVQTLIIQSADDPFMTNEVIPARDELSPTTELEIHAGAGHVGFVHGQWPWSARYWLDQYIPRRLAQYFAAAKGGHSTPRLLRYADADASGVDRPGAVPLPSPVRIGEALQEPR